MKCSEAQYDKERAKEIVDAAIAAYKEDNEEEGEDVEEAGG